MNIGDTLFSWFVDATLRASLLALAVFAIHVALRNRMPAPWRYAFWLPVVLVSLSPRLPESRWSLENRLVSRTLHVQQAASPLPPLTTIHDGLPVAEPATVISYARPRINWHRIAAATWLVGVGGMVCFALAAYARTMRRMVRGTRPADAVLLTMLGETALVAGLRRPPRLLVSTSVESPAVTGFLRPLLLLPARFPGAFTGDEARLVLLHEMIHLKRHDLPLNWVLCLLQAIHWCNPLLWLAFARMRSDREAACDAQVLAISSGDCRAEYGHALLKLEAGLANTGLKLGFLGIFERTADMRSRIRGIAAYRRGHPAWGVLAATLIAVLTVIGATRAQNPHTTDFEARSGIDVPNRTNPPAEKASSFSVTSALPTAFEVPQTFGLLAHPIELNVAPQVVEFEGFIDYGNPMQTVSTNALGQPVVHVTSNVVKQPTFRSHKVTTSEISFEWQTIEKIGDKAPLIAQLSPIGRPQESQSSGGQIESEIHRKLNGIIIPRLEFREATIREALEFLKRRSVELDTAEPDPARRGFNIVLDIDSLPAPTGGSNHATQQLNLEDARLSISLANIPFLEALKYVTELAHLKFRVKNNTVSVVAFNSPQTFLTKEFKLTPAIVAGLGFTVAKDPQQLLLANGVPFPAGAAAALSGVAGDRLIIRNTQENLDRVDDLLNTTDRPLTEGAPPRVENLSAVASLELQAVQRMEQKLKAIIIPRLEFREATTQEALDFLKRRSVELDTTESDPAKRGVNIVLKFDVPFPPDVTLPPGFESPAAAPLSGVNPQTARMTLSLSKIPLFEALKYVTELANLKFKIEPYGVVVLPKGAWQSKAESIIIPSLEFREATLREVVDFLKRKSIALDPDGKGINFVVKLEPPGIDEKKITLMLTNTSLWDAARAVAKQVDMQLSANPYALYFR